MANKTERTRIGRVTALVAHFVPNSCHFPEADLAVNFQGTSLNTLLADMKPV